MGQFSLSYIQEEDKADSGCSLTKADEGRINPRRLNLKPLSILVSLSLSLSVINLAIEFSDI